MAALIDLAPIWRALLLMGTIILCSAMLYCIISAVMLRVGLKQTALLAMLFLTEYLIYLPMCQITRYKQNATEPPAFLRALGQLPAILFAALLAILAVLTAYIFIREQRWQCTHISPMSIKEGADHLPAGLCFCEKSGRVLLINQKMDMLCHIVTGRALLNANAFWEALEAGNVQRSVRVIHTAPTPILMLPDKSVWSFERRPLQTGRGKTFEVTAADITDAYRLNRKLEEQNQKLRAMNERLQAYNDMVYEMTREEEMLAAKIQIHDKLGWALLTTRRYIEQDDAAIGQEELLKLWKYNIALLCRENSPDLAEDPLWELNNAASLVGARVVTEGDLPRGDPRAARLMMAVSMECLNNAVRHAGATVLYIRAVQKPDGYAFEFTNDGMPPAGPIIEGGGLSSIRCSVEAEGAEMRIQSKPKFALKLIFFKKGM